MKIRNLVKASSFMLPLVAVCAAFAAENPAVENKLKTSGPIEITADSLEVQQKKNIAIFTGHVVAVQGDVNLKSEKMTVYYKQSPKADKRPDSKETSPTAATGEKSSIEKIVVERNVFLTTPEETAKGVYGIYDVEKHKIYLNDNVVLTREKNVLKGDRLIYDFDTGKSVLNAPEKGKPTSRVKALFISNDEKK